MDAVVVNDFEEYSVEQIPRPSPGEEEVLIKVHQVQLSVTECWDYLGKESAYFDTVSKRIHNGDGLVFGHEFAGTVIETGSEVKAFDVGDRVYAPGKIPCRTCRYCDLGQEMFCEKMESLGYHRPGALAEYFLSPTEPLAKLPDNISNAEGAALQPLASALACVHDADITTGDVVAVIGTGVMGFQCGQLALHFGAERVYAIDVVPRKLELAEQSGMIGVDASDSDPANSIRDDLDGLGPDVVIEAVGGQQQHVTDKGGGPLAQAFEIVRKGGTVLQAGVITSEMGIQPRSLRGKMVRWVHPRDKAGVLSPTPNTSTGEMAASLVASDRVSISEYITHEQEGLSSFGDAVDITLNKSDYEALGPAQIKVSE